jgi:hypothetical protein
MIDAGLQIVPTALVVVLALLGATIITRFLLAAFGLAPPIDISWPWECVKSTFIGQTESHASGSTLECGLDSCECHCLCCCTCRVELGADSPDTLDVPPETKP